jgi:hypothetical protein
MSNALYGKGRNHFARGDIHWVGGGDTIMCTLVDTLSYVLAIDDDSYMNLDTVPTAARISTVQLMTLDPVLGVCDANDLTFPLVEGNPSEALIIWKDGGGGGVTQSGITDLLIAYIDSATGLPVTPNGGDVTVRWSDGANKIFKL